ncbi:uncharacterized protein LJ206_014212 [Theristicus caerulescens]
MAGVIVTILGFSTMGRPTRHQACWHPRDSPFSKGEEGLCSGACGAHRQGFKLDLKGEGVNIRFACDKGWDGTPWLEGQGTSRGWDASEGPQPVHLRRAGDTAAQSKSYGNEQGGLEVIGANREISEKFLKGTKGCSSKKVTWMTAQLKCLYTNARSMGNKQEELEATMPPESYDLVAITETWWDESHDWSSAIEGYRLFRRDRRGRRGGGVALYVKKLMECEELSLKNSHEQVERLWVRIRDRGNKGNLVVGVYCRPPDQGEPIDKDFFLQLQEASHSQALVLLGDFNHPDICWESNTAGGRQSRRLLECMEDNFLSQVTDSPTIGDAILDLVVTNVSELIGDVRIGGSLGYSDHTPVEFTVLRDKGQVKSIVRTLNFRKANFQLFEELINRTPWEMALRDKGAEQSWQIFKDAFHRAQELLIPRCKKSGKEGKRPAWLSHDLLVKLKGKKRLHRQWKKGLVSWEEYRDTAQLYKDGMRKAKAQLELNLVRDAKNNKKGFYRYINQKRKVKESIPPLMSKTGKLITTDKEKAEVLNNFFASVFTGNLSPHASRVNGPSDGDQGGKVPLTVREDQAGQLDEAGFKLKDSGVRVQSGNTHTIATNWGISQANQSSNKCSLAASQDENQKTSHLKCTYTNARSLGKKQEEMELHAQSESCDIIGITKTWWDNSHDWRIAMDGYRLFCKDRQGRKGGGVMLYVKENLECIEVNGNCGSPIECLWVKIRGIVSKEDLTNLVLMGDFNYPDICWKNNTAAHRSSMKFLECVEDCFFIEMLDVPSRNEALLDLLLTNQENLLCNISVSDSVDCSDDNIVEFGILLSTLKALGTKIQVDANTDISAGRVVNYYRSWTPTNRWALTISTRGC